MNKVDRIMQEFDAKFPGAVYGYRREDFKHILLESLNSVDKPINSQHIIKRWIAWYKTCLIRTNGYINIYNAIALTIVLFKAQNVPVEHIPLGVIGILIFVLLFGSFDILSGIYEAENKIGAERNPVMMEILETCRRFDKKGQDENKN